MTLLPSRSIAKCIAGIIQQKNDAQKVLTSLIENKSNKIFMAQKKKLKEFI